MNVTEMQQRFEELASLIDGARMLIESHGDAGLASGLEILRVAVGKAIDAYEEANTEAQASPEYQPA
ncbi:MAG: hypothetical protein J0I24_15470 [Thiomonas arsenitoxydans]|jgi:hypothetical protein|uniref:Uncharacterized protein n=1 Tax=Thiomonas arsenitoxydans (strain DSM 22701 / CIP 110005 / 3As) TaxID=426114 RepID=A0A8I1MZ78_THIA3|nr:MULTISPECIES: hypothetical protein [Thiomonas]MBN8745677.1 hypothetical protein [Thiomonas arsenitoxydans]ODU94008.1 MAG: hypothetical protein ABT24_13060 [Thiomonas sp. SCN 64-16]